MNAALREKKLRYVDILAQTGLAKTSIWRHSHKCLRLDDLRIAAERDPRSRTRGREIVLLTDILTDDGVFIPQGHSRSLYQKIALWVVCMADGPAPALPTNLPDDVIVVELCIRFRQAPINNPQALSMYGAPEPTKATDCAVVDAEA